MKQGVELPYRPDAPCEIRRDLSGRKGAAGSRASSLFSPFILPPNIGRS